ncbi:MAG TPA: aspartyl/asparaginyl beta-hydroxylase domain-containing protein [Rudaea sp.]|jgi:aspartate beta-hydroxylase|uniref:aspartyl/asparaginyl beta-hydroxylase domain-containing protein n=1 Tax=Rudaea sp. TaxID=2136325 RepID=UPI002F951EFB
MDNAAASALDSALRIARSAAEQGRDAEAESAFARALTLDPEHAEALHFCGLMAFTRGDARNAVDLIEHACRVDGENVVFLKNLGLAYLAASRPDAAQSVLERAVQIDPKFFVARLFLARLCEDIGERHEALKHYFRAILAAQAKGLWRSDETTAPGLRKNVKHAMRFVDAERRLLFVRALEPLREAHGEASLARVMHCLDIYLELAPANYPDPRQRPKFLYFPDLPTTPYLDRALFPWYAQLEDNFTIIRDELLAVLRDEQGIEPFLKINSTDDVTRYLAGAGDKPVWDAFFFYRHGERMDANCARCPRTAAIIESLPIVRIREHAPEICFSVLTPGTHILPHRGVTNTRLVTHLPLIVPENCALTVGGEQRVWQEGQCFTFDDTFEHEAWNRGASTRVVMLLDCWNPHLTEVEREAVISLVGAIGDFNRECGIAQQ